MVKEVSKHELRIIINLELSRLEVCPGCRINDVFLLENADSSGCNWERSEIGCADFIITNKCKHVVDHVTTWAKENYKLSAPMDVYLWPISD